MPNHCAPGRGDSVSCFTHSSLERIANHWNSKQKNPADKIKNSRNKKILWNRISQKFRKVSNCPDEWCWVDSEYLKDLKDEEIHSRSFKPKMPFPWKKKKDLWLNTLDIGAVLSQYHQKHTDFLFIGPVPLDFDSKNSGTGQCVVNELCKLNIEKLYRSGIRKLGIVINFDPHTKAGSHWVAMYCDFNTGGIYYFDSYGYKPLKQIADLLERIHSQGNHFLYKKGVPAVHELDDSHTTVCKVQCVSPNMARFACKEFVNELHVGDLVGACRIKQRGGGDILGDMSQNKLQKMCQSMEELRYIKHIDHRNKLVTFDRPLANSGEINLLVHKCFKIYVNKNRHQYKHSECGTYAIWFITQMLNGMTFEQLGKKSIPDEEMLKNRVYFYRPNMDSKDENAWLTEMLEGKSKQFD